MGYCLHPPALLSELCDGGNLRQHLARKDPWGERLLLQASQGMMFLHSVGVIHGDLKPENILIHQGVAKISDYGFSRLRNTSSFQDSLTGVKGTLRYMAPEVYAGKIEKPADVYAFAMVMYEVMGKGIKIFPELLDAEVSSRCHVLKAFDAFDLNNSLSLWYQIMDRVRASSRPERPTAIGQDQEYVWQLIERCWAQTDSDRPPFSEINSRLHYWAVGEPDEEAIDVPAESGPTSSDYALSEITVAS